MKCIIGRGQLIGHPGPEHEAEVAVVIGDLYLPSCIDHAEGFAESQDRVVAEKPEYAPLMRLARLDEMPARAPRFERSQPIATPPAVQEPPAPPIAPRAPQPVSRPANRTPRPPSRTPSPDDELRRIMVEGF